MTKQAYLNKLDKLERELNSSNAQEVIKKLDELFEYKPVRLKWMIVKAKAMLQSGKKVQEIFSFLRASFFTLYNYDGVEEISELYSQLNLTYNDILDAERNKLRPWIRQGTPFLKYDNEIEEAFFDLHQKEIAFCDDSDSVSKTIDLLNAYFVVGNYVNWFLLSLLLKKRKISFQNRKFICEAVNYAWLEERVLSQESDYFIIVITDEKDVLQCDVAATVLSLLGKKVLLLDCPIGCTLDNDVDLKETIPVCLDNMHEDDGVSVISPVRLFVHKECKGDNRAELIHHIVENYTESGLATILCSGNLMDELRESPVLRQKMQRLDDFAFSESSKYLSFGWVGSYIAYISLIFGFDVQEALDRPAECDFSIVIPVRNSVQSLQYTMMTCLNQKYLGSYEIVVSDNSTNGNIEVYEFCKSLNNPIVRYYRTPRDLHLPKSFEFAYLKARGKFIFSIGADDGLLPWSLETINHVLRNNSNEEIIQWERGFYAWPNFNGGQQNELIIPRTYRKGQVDSVRIRPKDYLFEAINDASHLYTLPMMYINSGFRRSYLKTLLKKTGYLLNGICQDIYLGVVNSLLYQDILLILYPITIAGMTSSSEGYRSSRVAENIQTKNTYVDVQRKSANIGGFSLSKTERLLPEIGTDVSSLYNCLLRAVTIGLITLDEIKDKIGMEKLFHTLLCSLRTDDVYFDRKIHYFRYIASKYGKEFLNWFDQTIYCKVMEPQKLNQANKANQADAKTYIEGFQSNGALILDASKFGVTNIAEAASLYEKLLNL